jgi:RsmE family RNA methyltransferase
MNLLLLEPGQLRADATAVVDGAGAEHVQQTLRPALGQRLRVGLREGPVGEARVRGWVDGRLLLDEVTLQADPPPRAGVGILLAMPRPKALRRILPAAASLGVDLLVVINAENVDRSYLDSPVLLPDSVQRLFDLGLEQAGDTRSPVMRFERRFRPFVEDTLPALLEDTGARWLLDPRAPPPPESSLGSDDAPTDARRWLAIGPETGWNDFERGLLATQGFTAVSLGPRILRVETVVPYALGCLHPRPHGR